MLPRATVVLLGALAALLAASPSAQAQVAYAPCQPAGVECGRLAVPIDRAGVVPGTVTLSIERAVAASNPTASAVVGLAGGPGQAALPALQAFGRIMAPALATRDLVVFDQRGTGSSSRLRCSALEAGFDSIIRAADSCATEIGPARGFFRSAESVDDIEAIRVASGYQRLVLFGVSYGTKVAEDYAARYPANVEALVLDSVVPPEGSDVLNVSTFRAITRVLGELCSNGACRGITTSPRRDLGNLVRPARSHPIRGTVTTPSGRRLRVGVKADDLYGILAAGDLNPTLRAELPGAMHGALRGDRRPLLRLFVRAEGLTGIPGTAPAGLRDLPGLQAQADGGDSPALLLATRCEESAFPWDRAAGPDARAAQASAVARAHPTSDFAPFGYRTALRSEAIPVCLGWPDASPPPAPPSPLPAVPTLVISGNADLRTPQEDAASVSARIPGAQLLAVPFTGHSVLGSDLSGCAQAGVTAFFAGQAVAPCAAARPPFAPTPVAPTRLSRVPGRTRAKKTIAAVAATVTDVRRQFLGDAIAAGVDTPAGAHVAGLRSGRATAVAGGFRLRRVSYVPGVTVSGTVPRTGDSATLTVSGRVAPHGSLRFFRSGRVSGRLGGRRVSGSSARAASAMTPAGGWPSRPRRIPAFP